MPQRAQTLDTSARPRPATALAALGLMLALLALHLAGAVGGLATWILPKPYHTGRDLRSLLVAQGQGDATPQLVGMAVRDAAGGPGRVRVLVVPAQRGNLAGGPGTDAGWWTRIFTRNVGEMIDGPVRIEPYDPALPQAVIDGLRARYRTDSYSPNVYIVRTGARDDAFVLRSNASGSQIWLLPSTLASGTVTP